MLNLIIFFLFLSWTQTASIMSRGLTSLDTFRIMGKEFFSLSCSSRYWSQDTDKVSILYVLDNNQQRQRWRRELPQTREGRPRQHAPRGRQYLGWRNRLVARAFWPGHQAGTPPPDIRAGFSSQQPLLCAGIVFLPLASVWHQDVQGAWCLKACRLCHSTIWDHSQLLIVASFVKGLNIDYLSR